MSTLDKVDKHVIMVMNWFNDPTSVSQDERTSNRDSAKDAHITASNAYDVVALVQRGGVDYDAAIATADAAYITYEIAENACRASNNNVYSGYDGNAGYANKRIDDYFKLVNIDRKEVEAELFGGKEVVNELVQNPKHYELFEDTSVIEVIASSMSAEAFHGYCLGNILKYRLRSGKKDDTAQELSKANKYNELYAKYKHLCR